NDNITYVNGSAVIRYINSTLQVNGINYDNTLDQTEEHLDFFLPQMGKLIKNTTTKVLSLEGRHLNTIETSNKIWTVAQKSTQHAATLYAICIILTIAITLAWIFRRKKHTFHTHPEHALPIVMPTIPSLWPSLRTGGGGVTDPSVSYTTPPAKPPPHQQLER
ncbi:hypothetical protein KR044_004972, partial [Drosophila immigrans]